MTVADYIEQLLRVDKDARVVALGEKGWVDANGPELDADTGDVYLV